MYNMTGDVMSCRARHTVVQTLPSYAVQTTRLVTNLERNIRYKCLERTQYKV